MTAVQEKLDRLYDEASRAAQHHEQLRLETAVLKRKSLLLQRAVTKQQTKQRKLAAEMGQLARAQYRGDLVSGLIWVLVKPARHDPLYRMSLLHSAHHNLASALRRMRESTAELKRLQDNAFSSLDVLRKRQEDQAIARKEIARKVLRARAMQRQLTEEAVSPCRAQRMQSQYYFPGQNAPSHPVMPWVSPVRNYALTAGFGAAGARWGHRHTGQDFAVPVGSPVHAVGDGVVVEADCIGAFGNNIIIQHDNGYFTHYAHLSVLQAQVGKRVRAGELVALSGTTGNSSGPHLHFEVRITRDFGSAVDPVAWMREHGVTL